MITYYLKKISKLIIYNILEMKNNIQVLDSTGAWRSAEVISEGATKKFVHFLNFSKKYDGEYEIGKLWNFIVKINIIV